MKRKITAIALLLTLLVQLMPNISFADNSRQAVRGIWVASVLNLDYPTTPTKDEAQLKADAIDILDRAEKVGFNTIYLQVRPTADAFYKSDIFPWSKYLTGKEATAPQNGFDPLAFWVEQAHARGIELHAWLNPYRITKRKDGEAAYTTDMLSANHPARLHPDWVVSSGGNLYFDPALPQVQNLIVQGVSEIIENYDVDGIHFDDYFYPSVDFDDQASYQMYGNGADKDDWRRANVNAMVRAVYKTVKAHDKRLQFGISPFGIWANQTSLENGSATKGNQSYFAHYADSLTWINEGIIDYIAPQIYWHIGFDIANYTTLVDWWIEHTAGTGVELIIGQAAYRLGDSSQKSPWYGNDQIFRQLAYNMTKPQVSGSIFFRDGNFKDSPSLSSRLKHYYQMVDSDDTYKSISINFPNNGYGTRASKTYIAGYANPYEPLYINGRLVSYRAPKGYFGTQVAVAKGKNVFTFKQGDNEKSIVIYGGRSSSGASTGGGSTKPNFHPDEPRPKNVIDPKSTWPQKQQLRVNGEKIWLACDAPIGATVSVDFNGETINLKPKSTKKSDYKVLTTFSSYYSLPKLAEGETSRIFAAPVYKMSYRGKTDSKTAPANFTIITEPNNYYARVIKDHIDTYFEPNPREGSDYILEKGMVDGVVRLTNKYVKLASGRWTYRSNVSVFYDLAPSLNEVSSATYKFGERFDYVDIKMSQPVAVSLKLKDGILAAQFANTAKLPAVTKTGGGLIGKVVTESENNRATYKFTFNDFSALHGYYSEKTADGVRIYLKKAVPIVDDAKPLTNMTIMIDPGHGGSDSGALGMMGTKFSEKHINIATSRPLKAELERRGAKVIMTRNDDVFISLQDRLKMSLAEKPDLFVSMHADSINADRNLSAIHGFSVHYKREIAARLANAVHDNIVKQLKRYDRKVKVNNFYVVRGTWAPSFLIEAGFVPNAYEFEWLTTEQHQREFAAAIADGIVEFFRR